MTCNNLKYTLNHILAQSSSCHDIGSNKLGQHSFVSSGLTI